MDFDEYEYLEKTVEESERGGLSSKKSAEKTEKGYRRRERSAEDNSGGDEDRKRTRSRGEDERERHRDERERSSRSERDRDRDRDRHRNSRDRDRESERERERGSREKEREIDRDREKIDKEKEREREREKRERERRERDKERDREMSRRSRSRSKSSRRQDSDRERERAILREGERDLESRESRRFKEKKEVEPEADPERDQRTVFAYQMPLKATERDVYEFFSKAGKVRDVRLIMDRNSRRSKGVGYIEFYDAMSVPMAIALSGHLLLGQPVMVKPSEAEKNLVQSSTSGGGSAVGPYGAVDRKLYVGNLHFNMTEFQLKQIFEAFGPVELVQLPTDPETGHCKGFGFIQFVELDHAKAAQSLNGKLEIAGRIIKVSSVTDHVGVQDSGAKAADFDDGEGGGLSLNAQARALLMQKLDRSGIATSIAGPLGVQPLNGKSSSQQGITLHFNGQTAVPASVLPVLVTSVATEPIGKPSECLLLKNMFDPATETDPEFDLDIRDDVQEECSNYGKVKHIYVNKNSAGYVYLRFETVEAAAGAQRAMHNRWFARRLISAVFLQPYEYEAKFKDAA
ncbi:RNA-binding protein like [Actinidia chinensis var. chinensis]|uniref:RNA-binding protein like n=1 Tax=Actinidia chinensis var. chinensis TaxID=1590841 RepID=A0A2R6RJW2_ACTCC|nr:RNA-binding protein like [Actinidia chinensis var. chinensis]